MNSCFVKSVQVAKYFTCRKNPHNNISTKSKNVVYEQLLCQISSGSSGRQASVSPLERVKYFNLQKNNIFIAQDLETHVDQQLLCQISSGSSADQAGKQVFLTWKPRWSWSARNNAVDKKQFHSNLTNVSYQIMSTDWPNT